LDLKKKQRNELGLIVKLLNNNLKGLTISDIAEKLSMNRNKTSKYLAILEALGNAEMKEFGSAKVYYPADRIPISTLLNLTSEGIVIVKPDLNELRIIRANDTFLKFLESERNNIINEKIGNIIEAFDSDPELQNLITTSINGGEDSMEKKIIISGKTYFFDIHTIPIVLEEINPGICIFFKDITVRKLAEIKLKKSEQLYKLLFEESPNSIVLLDTDGKILDCNPTQVAMFGWDREKFIGRNFRDFKGFHQDYISKVEDAFSELTGGKIPEPIEVVAYNKNHEMVWIRLQGSFIELEDRRIIQVITTDISEIKELKKE
jgi:PAS domain S-box-containing protein